MADNIIVGTPGAFKGPGAYGRSLAKNVQDGLKTDPEKTLGSTFDINEPGKGMKMDNLLGLADQDLSPYRDKNGKVTLASLTTALGGQKETAQKLFTALDTNKDGEVDVAENAAYKAFQDDSINNVANIFSRDGTTRAKFDDKQQTRFAKALLGGPEYGKTVDALLQEQVDGKKLTADEAKALKADFDRVGKYNDFVLGALPQLKGQSSTLDGKFTANERAYAELFTLNMPEIARKGFEKLGSDFKLPERATDFLKRTKAEAGKPAVLDSRNDSKFNDTVIR